MNYRHLYHAGNFADVFKHVVLIAITQSFLRKETPFCVLETHAGRGDYDLSSEAAQKTQEYKTGIEKLMSLEPGDMASSIPSLIQFYKQIVQSYRYPLSYPGSSAILRALLREQDHLILNELHPEEALLLKEYYKRDRLVSVHEQDGYINLKALLPPKEKRGFIFIDPPYEQKEEWAVLNKALAIALKRFANGVYAIWYPIKDKRAVQQFLSAVKNEATPSLVAEFSIYPEDATLGLVGSGMVILNPPWQLKETLEGCLPWLWRVLSPQGKGGVNVIYLNT